MNAYIIVIIFTYFSNHSRSFFVNIYHTKLPCDRNIILYLFQQSLQSSPAMRLTES